MEKALVKNIPRNLFLRTDAIDLHEYFATVGYVPQHVNHNISFPATALDVVLMGAYSPENRFQFRLPPEKKQAALAILDKLGIGVVAHSHLARPTSGAKNSLLRRKHSAILRLHCRPGV